MRKKTMLTVLLAVLPAAPALAGRTTCPSGETLYRAWKDTRRGVSGARRRLVRLGVRAPKCLEDGDELEYEPGRYGIYAAWLAKLKGFEPIRVMTSSEAREFVRSLPEREPAPGGGV